MNRSLLLLALLGSLVLLYFQFRSIQLAQDLYDVRVQLAQLAKQHSTLQRQQSVVAEQLRNSTRHDHSLSIDNSLATWREDLSALAESVRAVARRVDQVQVEKHSKVVNKADFGLLKEQVREIKEQVASEQAAAQRVVERLHNVEQKAANGIGKVMSSGGGGGGAVDGGDEERGAEAAGAAKMDAWLQTANRARVIAVLNAKVYDVTAANQTVEREELLDDLHGELDRLVKKCDCGRDGASNNALQRREYLAVARKVRPNVICETGFNAGHGAAALLLGARKRATYVGFDLFSRAYVQRAVTMLESLFSAATVNVIKGSSGVAAARFFDNYERKAESSLRCDIVHIDGGRFQGMPLKDLQFFHRHSREGAIVIMDDVRCDQSNAHVCAEPGSAWQRMSLEGKIVERECFEKANEGVHFCIGEFRRVNE